MRKITFLIITCFISVCVFAARPGEPHTVVSFNIRYSTASDGADAWDNRKDWVNRLIQFHEADIFGVQEALHTQIIDLARLNQFGFSGKGRDDGDTAGEYSAIFYRSDRYQKLDEGTFWLSETPDKPSNAWGAQIKRICSWIKLRDRSSKQTFFVFNAHFDHQSALARENSAALLLRKIEEIAGDADVILMGDLNTTPDSKPLQTLYAVFDDSRKISQLPAYGPEGTFNGFKYQQPLKDNRIDYILLKGGFTVLKQGTLTDFNAEQRFPSDHFPVLAKILID